MTQEVSETETGEVFLTSFDLLEGTSESARAKTAETFLEQHILDWYHIARRFEAIGKGLVYLPHVEDFEHRLSRHWHHLNRAKGKSGTATCTGPPSL